MVVITLVVGKTEKTRSFVEGERLPFCFSWESKLLCKLSRTDTDTISSSNDHICQPTTLLAQNFINEILIFQYYRTTFKVIKLVQNSYLKGTQLKMSAMVIFIYDIITNITLHKNTSKYTQI